MEQKTLNSGSEEALDQGSLPGRKKLKDLLFVFLVGTGAFSLRWLPTFLAWLKRGDKIFLGANSLINPVDIWVYWGGVLQGKVGYFLSADIYGSRGQEGLLLKMFYLSFGHLGRFLNLKVEVAYLVGSYLGTLLLAYAYYKLSSLLFRDTFWRHLAFLVALAGKPFLLRLPDEAYSAASFFILNFPHYIFDHLGIVTIIYLFLRENQPSKKLLIWGLLAGFLLGLGHFFMGWLVLFLLAATMVVLPAFRKRKNLLLILVVLAAVLTMTLLSFPTLLKSYYGLELTSSAAGTFGLKNLIWPLVFFVLLALLFLVQGKKRPWLLFFSLAPIFQLLLILSCPFVWRLRLFNSLLIPTSFLLIAVSQLIGHQLSGNKTVKKVLFIFLLAYCFVDSFYLLLSEISWIRDDNPFLYVTQSEAQAWQFLKKRCDFSQVIYADWLRGIYLPAKTGCRSLIGLKSETPDYKAGVLKQVSILSGRVNPDNLVDYFIEEGVNYIFLTHLQARSANLAAVENLNLLYENEEFVIYEVNSPPG
ncbi:MAG: hypothetical protein JW991_02020 [Candidatus Pacebacteria bacterium]|nr:hypothetical protein [Candidatus Paceibacterota bacterium]